MPEEKEERRRQSERELTEHDRIMERNASHAARDVLHDGTAAQKPGAYTTYAARDRAAHTPSILEREGPRDRQEESQMIEALHKELFPTDKDWQAYREEGAGASGTQAPERQQKGFQADAIQTPAKEKTTMTPEQQANIDKVLDRGNMTDKISGASDVGVKPTPNEPTPIDKSRDIGQDLQKQGVTMDRD